MACELKKLRINELYSTLGYENGYPKRDAKLLDAVVHEFFKDFTCHNLISTAQVFNPGADLFATTFLEEEDRGERFWPTTHENVPVYPRDRPLITSALRQIFIRKKTAMECSKHAKKKYQRDSFGDQPNSSTTKRKEPDIPSDGQPSSSKKPRSKQLEEPKPWKERPQEPDARGCIDYIRSLNPLRDATDFTKCWLHTKKASWPKEADLRLQLLMHAHSFYISFDHGDSIPIGISQGMKKDTQIEELEAHQIKPFHDRISKRIHELTLKLIKEPPLVLRCRDDGVAVQTQKFSRMWSKKEDYWRVDPIKSEDFGYHQSSGNKRRKKSAKRKEPVIFPKIVLQDEESPMLETDELEFIADSALQFALGQAGLIANNNTQHHNAFERHLENQQHFGMVSDERAEIPNLSPAILVDTPLVLQNSDYASGQPNSPGSLAMPKESNASFSSRLTPSNSPPATEIKTDMEPVKGYSCLTSLSERPGSSLDSSIVIEDISFDEEDNRMEELWTRATGACDLVMENSPANGNTEMVRTSQRSPQRRRVLQLDGESTRYNNHIKDQLANRSNKCQTLEQLPREPEIFPKIPLQTAHENSSSNSRREFSDIMLTSPMVRNEAKSPVLAGPLESASLVAPQGTISTNDQSSGAGMASFVIGLHELNAGAKAAKDVDRCIAGAKPTSPPVFRDPVVNPSDGQASRKFHEVEPGLFKERPLQHQQSYLQRGTNTFLGVPAGTISSEAAPVHEAHFNTSKNVLIISTITSERISTAQTSSCKPSKEFPIPASANILDPVTESMDTLPRQKPQKPTPREPNRTECTEPAPREISATGSPLNDEALKVSEPKALDNSPLVSAAAAAAAAAAITQFHSVSRSDIPGSLEQSSTGYQLPVIDSEIVLPVLACEPRRNGSYNFVPPAIPFTIKPSAVDSAGMLDKNPIIEPLQLSDDRRLAPTLRNSTVPTLYLLIRDAKGNLKVEDSYPFDAYVKDHTVPEFFDFFSEVSGHPARSFGALIFRMNFGENGRIKVQRHSGENVWRKMWKEVHVEFKDAQREDPKEMEFDVTVYRVN